MRLFVFGLGYSARCFIARHGHDYSHISGTTRAAAMATGAADGTEALPFPTEPPDPAIAARLAQADALLVSIPPGPDGDPVLRAAAPLIAASGIRRIVYLSSVGVYADHHGDWIDESAAVHGESDSAGGSPGRRHNRIAAETAWRQLAGDRTSILRIAGIYGPGRNALVNLRDGKAHRIVKPGQVFNRIHVDDIAASIAAAFAHPTSGTWNVCDDEPAPPQDVVTFAASLMSVPPPPEQEFASAAMSPMARSFYASSNRISNARLKQQLGVRLDYPTYREGLTALWRSGAA